MYYVKGSRNGHRKIANARKAAYEKATSVGKSVVVDENGKEVGRVSMDYYPKTRRYVAYWLSEKGVWELSPSGTVRYRQ